MVRKRGRAASTVDELGGTASEIVSFIRTDARAVAREQGPSQTQLKSALTSSFEPAWPRVSAEAAASIVGGIARECSSSSAGARRPAGIVVGLRATSRAVKRGEIRVVVAASELQPPLLLAQLAVHAHAAGAHLAVLPSTAAALGQPLGLLRAAVLGLQSRVFDEAHALVRLVLAVPPPQPCWLQCCASRLRERAREAERMPVPSEPGGAAK